MTRSLRRTIFPVVLMALAIGVSSAGSTKAMGAIQTPANGRILFEAWGFCRPPQCADPSNPNYDIWSVAPDGSDLVNLTKAPGLDVDGAWSPDGTEIVFASNRNGDYDLFTMDADGTNLRQLTGGTGGDASPTWSPDGKRIAFHSNTRRTEDIVIMRRDGTGRRRIAAFAPAQLFGLTWSPMGGWLAFTKGPDENENWHVFVIRTDGTGLRRLDHDVPFSHSETPSWSPDGQYLVFEGGENDIWVVRRDGSGLRELVGGDVFHATPDWSPDGRQVVYLSSDGDLFAEGDLWIVDADGSNPRRLLSKPDTYDHNPDWQPVP